MTTQINSRVSRRINVKKRGGEELRNLVVPALISFAAGAAVLLGMISVIAYIFSKIDLPLSMMVPLATLSISIAVFAAALTFSSIYGRHGMLLGALAGIVLFFAVCGTAVSVQAGEFTQLSVVKGLLMTVCGALGGFFGVDRYQKQKQRKKRK